MQDIRAVHRFTGSVLSQRESDGTCRIVTAEEVVARLYFVDGALDAAALFPEIERVQRN